MIIKKKNIFNSISDKWWIRVLIFIVLYIPVYLYFGNVFLKIFGKNIPYYVFYLSSAIPPLLISGLLEGFRSNSKWHYFGLTLFKHLFKQIYQVLFIIVCGFVFFTILFYLLGIKPVLDFELESSYFCYMLVILLVSSLIEELFFRGIIFQALTERFGLTSSTIIISIGFSAVHYSNPHLTFISYLNIFLAGIFLSVLYNQTKSIIICLLSHFLWNFSQAFFLGSSVSGYDLGLNFLYFDLSSLPVYLSGGDFGIEGGLITSFVLIINTLLIIKYIKPSPYIESLLLKRDYSGKN